MKREDNEDLAGSAPETIAAFGLRSRKLKPRFELGTSGIKFYPITIGD
jgi:hypothetical protein